ncbi:flavin reductase [Actinoplanes sp. NPDC048791]|uniref:flavin reductase family protein n=1 Tax=Actinoplanes sp. NPDC048791 TaxID=3154623 RepID=UPI0033D8F9B5
MTVIVSRPLAPAPVDATLFRQVFRRHAAGVAVVTTDAGRGAAGVTVTSLASLSAEPPLLSFSISAAASFWPHLRDADTAVVHLLPRTQGALLDLPLGQQLVVGAVVDERV